MERNITDFHTDKENHWVAELECGHGQHVRHDPPLIYREWVLTEDGRKQRIGQILNCVRCDELATQIAETIKQNCVKILKQSYEQAGISGLCGEGQWEVAIGLLEHVDQATLLKALCVD